MKNIRHKHLLLTFLLLTTTTVLPRAHAQMGIVEAVKAAAKKVVKAVDLQVQRWQNKVIDLQNLQRKAENLLSKLRLEDIASWTDKQKAQYQQYFDELWRVKAILTYSGRFVEIINLQKQIVNEYATAYNVIRQDNHFTEAEISRMHNIYSGIVAESLSGIDNIIVMMKSFTVQMSDAQRIALINKTADELESYLNDLREFNQDNKLLRLQRARSQEEIAFIKKLYNF